MKLLIIRHAEKIKDEHGSSLTKKGFKQAKYLAKTLKKIKIDEFYCSELKRARETAEIVSKKIKLKPKIEESLNEYRFRDLKVNFKGAPKEYKDRLPRLKKFIEKITKNPDKKRTILIIAHGITNRIIFSNLFNLEPKRLIGFMQKETGITEIEWNEKHKNWRLWFWSNNSHLPNKLK
jgi:broad specificity phosphatase PhoE